MALLPCPDCGNKVSDSAAACPKCGRPISAEDRAKAKKAVGCTTAGCLTLVILGIIGSLIGGDGDGSSTPRQTGPSASMAYVMCQSFVKDRLKAPSSAKFPGMFEETYSDATTKLSETQFRVRSWVDAQNSFGAMIRNNYTCTVSYTGNDNWRLDGLEM